MNVCIVILVSLSRNSELSGNCAASALNVCLVNQSLQQKEPINVDEAGQIHNVRLCLHSLHVSEDKEEPAKLIN